jgi:ABC-type Fe3+-citrate transport system substrate-binding protein
LKERRERVEARAAEKRDRFIAEAMGRAMLQQQRTEQHQKLVSNINGVVKFFTQEHREITVEAIVEFLANEESYSPEFVTKALDELRASGDYDRTIAGEW